MLEYIINALFKGVFSWFLFAPIGFLYLYLRHRRKVRVQQVLLKDYENSYVNAGQIVAIRIVAATGLLLVLALMFAPLLHWLRS